MASAIMMTTRPASGSPPVIALITSPASTGVATAMPEEMTTRIRKNVMSRRYGLANRITRSAVARPTRLSPSSSLRRIERIMPQLLPAMPAIGWPTRVTSRS